MPRLSATAGPKGSTHQLLGAALRCHTRVAHGVSQSSPHAGGRDVSRPQGIFCARLFSAAGSARSWGGRGRALGPSSQDTAHRVTASHTARASGIPLGSARNQGHGSACGSPGEGLPRVRGARRPPAQSHVRSLLTSRNWSSLGNQHRSGIRLE